MRAGRGKQQTSLCHLALISLSGTHTPSSCYQMAYYGNVTSPSPPRAHWPRHDSIGSAKSGRSGSAGTSFFIHQRCSGGSHTSPDRDVSPHVLSHTTQSVYERHKQRCSMDIGTSSKSFKCILRQYRARGGNQDLAGDAGTVRTLGPNRGLLTSRFGACSHTS